MLQKEYDSHEWTIKDLKKHYPEIPLCRIRKNIKVKSDIETKRIASKKNIGRVVSDESKEKIRQSRINFLKEKNGDTAWERKNCGKMSYLEEWFYNNCILKYELDKKYIIINEYCEQPYFIDFAFINEKIAVELDGKVHFELGNKRINHDIKKDEYLMSHGWRIFRIPYFERNEKSIEKFLNFLINDSAMSIKITENWGKYLKYCEYKKEIKNKKLEEKNKVIKEKERVIKEKVMDIKNSNINFNKFGWKAKVGVILECSNTHVGRWMKKHLPDIYNNAFSKCRINKGVKAWYVLLFSYILYLVEV